MVKSSKTNGNGAFGAVDLPVQVPVDMEAVVDASTQVMQLSFEFQNQILRSMEASTREYQGFINRRLAEDRMTAKELAQCRSVVETMSVWNTFLQRAVSQYAEEAGRFTAIGAELARDTSEKMQMETPRPGAKGRVAVD